MSSTYSWRLYCLKCDSLLESLLPGDPIPEPRMHSCGRMLILVSGLYVQHREEYRIGELVRRAD